MPSIADHFPRAWAVVNLAAVVSNARTVSRIAGARLLPMLKANAYGLGAVPIARALAPLEPWGFGVATPEEGAELRRAGIDFYKFLRFHFVQSWIAQSLLRTIVIFFFKVKCLHFLSPTL